MIAPLIGKDNVAKAMYAKCEVIDAFWLKAES